VDAVWRRGTVFPFTGEIFQPLIEQGIPEIEEGRS